MSTQGHSDNMWDDSEVVGLAFGSPQGLRELVANTSDQETLKSLINAEDYDLVRAATRNPAIWSVLDEPIIQIITRDFWSSNFLLRNKFMPEDAVASLMDFLSPDELRTLAESPKLPEDVMDSLVRNESSRVRMQIARNSGITSAMVDALANDSEPEVCASVASHPSITSETLFALAHSEDPVVRAGAAGNRLLPGGILEALAQDPDSSVRLRSLGNPAMPLSILRECSTHSDSAVRAVVGRNTSAPADVLETLGHDSDKRVRRAVASNVSAAVALLESLAQDREGEVRDAVAKNYSASPTILEQLSRDTNFLVRQSVSKHPHISRDVMERLSQDKSWETREMIAQRPDCPESMLSALASDIYPDIPKAVARNSGTPIHVVKFILDRWVEEAATDVETAKDGDQWKIYMWPEATERFHREIVFRNSTSLESFWREYFECWSTQEAFADRGPFEPLELAAEIEVEGAAELLSRAYEFVPSERLEETRDSYSVTQSEFTSWILDYIPVVPDGVEHWLGFTIDNTDKNRSKLRQLDPNHIWTIIWGDVPWLTEGFSDDDDQFRVLSFFVTDQPHGGEGFGNFVCDLALRVTCVLCDGDAISDKGRECPACEGQGEVVVSVEHGAIRDARKQIPPTIRPITGWCT